MPPETSAWDQLTRRFVQLFSRQEVKTPLSFFFRVSLYMGIFWIATLYSPIPEAGKYWLIKFSAAILGGLAVMVALFAWFRPRNLVYGEAGHRAERKMEYGTERRILNVKELESLPGVENPKLLDNGKNQ